MRLYLSNVSSRYGAPMGRMGGKIDPDEPGPYRLQRIRLDSGGYDSGGAYWGSGISLWCVEDPEGERVYFRAPTRESAKAKFLDSQCPVARFYR